MKKSLIIGLIFSLVIVVLFATNPNEEQHITEVKTKLKKAFKKEMAQKITDESNILEILGGSLGLSVGDYFIDNLADGFISRDNYFLFSLTKVEFQGENKIIGMGILDNVFIRNEIDDIFKEEQSDKVHLTEDNYSKEKVTSKAKEEDKIKEWLETSLTEYLVNWEDDDIRDRIFTSQYLEYKNDAYEVFQPYDDFQTPDDMTEEEFHKKWKGIFNTYLVDWEAPLHFGTDNDYTIEYLKQGLSIEFKEKKRDVYYYNFHLFTSDLRVIRVRKQDGLYKIIDILEYNHQ